MKRPDIDIDFADRNAALAVLSTVPAMIERDGKKVAHPSGAYLQDMPIDPFTNLAALDYKVAEDMNYFKFDFLNQSVYSKIRDEDHLITLLNTEPPWEILDEKDFVDQLPHIYNHFDVVQAIKPTSIADLSLVLALVRPGKKHLLGKSRAEIEEEIWKPSEDGYTFRKAHAVSYSGLVVVRMNLLVEEIMTDDSPCV